MAFSSTSSTADSKRSCRSASLTPRAPKRRQVAGESGFRPGRSWPLARATSDSGTEYGRLPTASPPRTETPCGPFSRLQLKWPRWPPRISAGDARSRLALRERHRGYRRNSGQGDGGGTGRGGRRIQGEGGGAPARGHVVTGRDVGTRNPHVGERRRVKRTGVRDVRREVPTTIDRDVVRAVGDVDQEARSTGGVRRCLAVQWRATTRGRSALVGEAREPVGGADNRAELGVEVLARRVVQVLLEVDVAVTGPVQEPTDRATNRGRPVDVEQGPGR